MAKTKAEEVRFVLHPHANLSTGKGLDGVPDRPFVSGSALSVTQSSEHLIEVFNDTKSFFLVIIVICLQKLL